MTYTGHALFCDDIREETSGKHILIGVYSGEMNVNAGPAVVSLSVWVQIYGLAAGDRKIKFNARKQVGSQRIEIARIEAGVEVLEEGIAVGIPLTGMPLSVDSDCTVTVSMSCDAGEEVKIGSLTVKALFADLAT